MRRKDLEVGKEYYTSSTPLDEVTYWNNHTRAKVRVEDATNGYVFTKYWGDGFSADLNDFRKTKNALGVLVSFEEQNAKKETVRYYRVVQSRLIRAPYEQAKEEVTERLRKEESARLARVVEARLREENWKNVVKPALNSLTSALNTLAVEVTGEASYIHDDTPLRFLPLDVIEALTLIVREAVWQEVSA